MPLIRRILSYLDDDKLEYCCNLVVALRSSNRNERVPSLFEDFYIGERVIQHLRVVDFAHACLFSFFNFHLLGCNSLRHSNITTAGLLPANGVVHRSGNNHQQNGPVCKDDCRSYPEPVPIQNAQCLDDVVVEGSPRR